MSRYWRSAILSCGLVVTMLLTACSGNDAQPTAPSATNSDGIDSDSALYAFVTQTQPFASYARFPNVDVIRSGSSAHQPLVLVSMNATASAALQNGRLPAGTKFPDGSVILKEVRIAENGPPSIYAVMYKNPNNSRAGGGWVWAEFRPGGSVAYSTNDRGGGCTGCHSLAQGLQNDLVRTFERQQ